METRNLILAIVLSMAVLVTWSFLFPAKPPQRPPAPSETAETAPEAADEAAGTPAAPGPSTPADNGQPSIARPALPVVAASQEERVVLETDELRAVFTNRGAQLVSLEVKGQTADSKGLDLVRARQEPPYPYALVGNGLAPHPLNGALFAAQRGADGRSVSFRYNGPLGAAEKRFHFDGEGLLEAEVAVPGRRGWGLLIGPGVRNPTLKDLKSRFEHRGALYRTDEVHLLDAKSSEKAIRVEGGAARWVGLEDTYFLTASLPRGGVERVVFQPVLFNLSDEGRMTGFDPLPPEDQMTSAQEDQPREYVLVFRPEGDRLSLATYWGAKEYEKLAAQGHGFQESVRLGMFWFLARPLLAGLHWIHQNVIANYGWAIILLTVVIKLLMLPLTHQSMKSMRKMQTLNPKMQAIRERYRPKLRDKQGRPNLEMQRKMNEEVMALYKSEGVNPAGGCLPLVLQMPILFAFYNLLSTAVELRGAPWMLWIHDLSVQDPYYILPIVMGATQFLQVKLGPQATDPMQRRMFQIMPVVMTFMFLGFPSGLVLYWLTNNVLTIAQQSVYNHLRQREA
ncbi:MAG TPA: membrane protein insertase YidC [Thermoanaerobaculia bacterium]|nr:membrane protein insertase YidC [Thermoanaerobaculia bacterium]